ncbi:MAG: glycosyltransferase family 1 protein [Chloroflexi bacterium HGW-Chloroflexi-1]|nr:MAG: glycosyltransferase family 1 protein [Chloroflexi bacterium HGW-Chloroflexi-1]
MPIYLDISAAVHHRAGLGRYAESLARELRPLLGDRLAFFYNREQGVEPLAGLADVPARTVELGYKPWRMLVWAGQAAGVGFNRLIPGAELFHATEHLLLPLQGIPTVLTVHDLIFRRLPEHHKPLNRWYLNLTLPLFCRRATHVIAVSEQTRRDLISTYHLPPEKITVIQEAADPRFRPQPPETVAMVQARYSLPDRYVLFVSTIEPRKNLIRLLAAFERVHAAGLTDALVIVGKRGWLYDDFFAALERSPARQAVIFPGYVPDADLPAVYGGSQVCAFPSLFEGFGLPVLEAMACGAPVVCSNTSSLPEVAGDAALLVDPLDIDAIADTLYRLLADPDLRADLARRGLVQAARFSWPRAATETLAVYRRLLQKT